MLAPSSVLTELAAPAGSVLIASGNGEFRGAVRMALLEAHHRAEEAAGGAEALMRVEDGGFTSLILDRCLPDLDATELAAWLKVQHPELNVVVLDSGIQEPLTPPPAPARIFGASRLFWEGGEVEPLPGLVGHSAEMAEVSWLVRLVAPRRTAVLLLGESGTGKEMIARAIHQTSSRHHQPMVVVNCAAIPESLLESELFGYAKGAFTGAGPSRLGRIQAAHGGTLFLDEIGEMPLNMQAKLLRFLQEGEIQRLGSNDTFRVDVRVIAATNVDLEKKVESGEFRRDLYYRLAVFPIELRPLRQRAEDISELAQYFLDRLQEEAQESPKRFSPAATQLLKEYAWQGNVRELQHSVERAWILAAASNEILPRHLPALLRAREAQAVAAD